MAVAVRFVRDIVLGPISTLLSGLDVDFIYGHRLKFIAAAYLPKLVSIDYCTCFNYLSQCTVTRSDE